MRIDPSHVEIPADEIDKLVETYGCTQEEAVRAYLSATESSDTAFNDTLGSILGSPEKGDIPTAQIHTPAEIRAHLDKYVIGQADYKKRLSIAAAYHFAIVHAISSGAAADIKVKRFRKKNTIISGPSGSGKTYCVEILGDMLEVPTLIVDATDYTEAGYVGKSADDMIRELISLAPGGSKQEKADFVEANGGFIFIDEMDKKAKDGKVIGHDISREGFQRAVLKLIERKQISVEDPMSPASQIQDIINQQRGMAPGQKKRSGNVSTENILFILGGSFQRTDESLEQIVKKRIERGEGKEREDGSFTITGFVAGNDKKEDKPQNYYKEANEDDYIRFGIIPELVGRAPVRTYVNALSKNDLIRIMKETEDSILEQYIFEFSLFGIDLKFNDDALMWIAEKAENRKTGARALISVFENVLTDLQFELPSTNFKEIEITKEICEAPRDAMLKMMARSPFVDFIEKFKRDQGIDLSLSEKVEKKIEKFAKDQGIPISAAIEKVLTGASALNYMDWKGIFEVTEEVVDNPKYFDQLFVKWKKKHFGSEGSALP
ncbi:ATP-dependent Clp protease ATP-binding subunit ClpX [hydrothermal vent metagenome]|uniref:ATP-dependent Clp protease ATP-binding subunit ClpX n=1 Tax=hydrothermal vent metagenome TaxID=652676 RepID=A0A3B1BXH8_9ZZZZ